MAYIRQIEPADATGELRAFYDALFDPVGSIPNIVKLSSLKPSAASAAEDLYQSVLYHDLGLAMEEKEMVATAVSVINASSTATSIMVGRSPDARMIPISPRR